ncbi:MAG: hypothetical protein IAE90_01860 [Ignavibacteria bacterium]|nr:hypothetical protein [Ignavibacteria bacterium]
MPVSNDIFELVRVMTRKEKSFFRRYSRLNSAGKDGAMIKLFEKLVEYSAERDTYDEEVLKNGLDAKTIKHFPVVKNNLYKLLLKSMNVCREDNNNTERVKNLLEQYDILFSKSLLKQCESILRKARKISEENEMFFHLQDIMNKERVLARYMLDADSYEKVIEKVYREQIINLEKIRNLTDMNDLGNRLTILSQKNPTAKARDESLMAELKYITEHPLLKDESKMLSSTTLKRFYNLNTVTSEWRSDHSSAMVFARKYSELVEKEVEIGKSTIHEYIISLYANATACTRVDNFDEYEIVYEKLAGIHERFEYITERDKLEAFYYLGLDVFSASASNYHPERGLKILEEAELNHEQMGRWLSVQQKIVWYFVIARFCFSKGTYNDAGRWLNRLIQIPNIDVSQDYQCYARIMNLVVAYESGNPDRIEHELRRSYYFLTKRNKIYKYERIILEYTRQAFKVRSQKEINEMLEFMHRDLSSISNDPFEKNAFDAFNMIPWLEEKLLKT